jgi:hypothetical protein
MQDVVGQIVIAVTDKDFLSCYFVDARLLCARRALHVARNRDCAKPLCFAFNRADIRPGLWLSQIHSPGPCACDEFRQIDFLYPFVAMHGQKLDSALIEQPA